MSALNGYCYGKQATKILGVHIRTLYNWDKKGLIEVKRTAGGRRMYNVKKYLKENPSNLDSESDSDEEESSGRNISYVRVSSKSQKDDLKRQIEYMKENYPDNEIIQDIGSGLDMKRPGLLKILDIAISGDLDSLVVAHKDRLARFGYDLIETLVRQYSQTKITIANETQKKEPQAELVDDILHIMNVFTAKINGMRKYKKKGD